MIRPDGRAKILDFGLARFSGGELSTNSSMSTQTLGQPVTGEGMVVGTVSYMSPEQAEGKTVDVRSDIFSLGAVLYEMASGRKPFRGDTTLSIMTSILRDDPAPLSGDPALVPRELERVILRCLKKEPDRRFQTAIDVRNALEEVEEDLRSVSGGRGLPGQNPARGTKFAKWLMAGAGMLVLAAALFTIARPSRIAPESIVVRPLGMLPGVKLSATFSPDGNAIVFIWGRRPAWRPGCLRDDGRWRAPTSPDEHARHRVEPVLLSGRKANLLHAHDHAGLPCAVHVSIGRRRAAGHVHTGSASRRIA